MNGRKERESALARIVPDSGTTEFIFWGKNLPTPVGSLLWDILLWDTLLRSEFGPVLCILGRYVPRRVPTVGEKFWAPQQSRAEQRKFACHWLLRTDDTVLNCV